MLEIPQLFEGKKLSFVGLVNGQQITSVARAVFWLWNWKMLISTVLLYSRCIVVCPCYHEFKLIFLKNHTEFWIRVKKLFEPIVLPRKGDGLLLFLKYTFWDNSLSVTLRDLTLERGRGSSGIFNNSKSAK